MIDVAPTTAPALLEISGLTVELRSSGRTVRPVDGIDLSVNRGQTVGLVGESGSGKTLTALSIPRLLPETAHIAEGRVELDGEDLAAMPERELRGIRGRKVGMVFQDPLTALNPVLRVGAQIAEVLFAHGSPSRADVQTQVLALLKRVHLSDPERVASSYPHQLSGGMRQRALIAMAIACGPALLIADEPTSALDASVQSRVLQLLREFQRETGMGLLIISHDLALVRSVCDELAVMYAGRIVEQGRAETVLTRPAHPYTSALLAARPQAGAARRSLLAAIPGTVPSPDALPSGCRFRDRCSRSTERCAREDPALSLRPAGQRAACHHPLDGEGS